MKPKIRHSERILSSDEHKFSELCQRQECVNVFCFWMLLFCLAFSQTKDELVFEDSYFFIDCKEELYGCIPFGSISVRKLNLKYVKIYKEFRQRNSSFVFDQCVADADKEKVQVQAYALFCLLRNANYLSSLTEIIFAGITNVNITDFANLVWKENESCCQARTKIAYQFIEKNFNSVISFARFRNIDYFKVKILPLIAKTQMNEDAKVDENEQIVKINKSDIRKKEYDDELEETKSVNEFLRGVDEPSLSSHSPVIELVLVDSEVKYNCLLKN
eukprot:CAMPEP_0168345602 /NCGR_PEP_ID=MMETSP0213-20121227/17674_1 /TAXON_ID=151035 /ORGANISM="Euplotes harpa, Strain FSP1.4" /LENGTH=273 /DNA_ID=CAMNT_0008353895 /DNA_START=1929 /DNA_END=2748 /DNA_ORIENTATION=+